MKTIKNLIEKHKWFYDLIIVREDLIKENQAKIKKELLVLNLVFNDEYEWGKNYSNLPNSKLLSLIKNNKKEVKGKIHHLALENKHILWDKKVDLIAIKLLKRKNVKQVIKEFEKLNKFYNLYFDKFLIEKGGKSNGL